MNDEALKHAKQNGEGWATSILELWEGYKKLDEREADTVEADGCTFNDTDEIREHVMESVLSVEVRGDWHNPGCNDEAAAPTEFRVLCSTGGPALQIVGDLDEHNQPENPKIQIQDWGTPWMDYDPEAENWDNDALEWWISCFYFGE